ncbi:MAG: hypothetical protein A2Y10_19470 [Planctomycetes bacterium GWF2_41_51]|nr:MAG: hypothetical protein A2Y10_19470 [Planctomycetes bacterium GWF2_41_51]HBG28162.1 hypothetical protein [Phycisphaerales bacterium]
MPANVQKSSDSSDSLQKFLLAFLFIALISITIIIRIRFLSTPLERDEGEYAYAGQLMLQGIPPYSLAYNMKMPGIYAAYAVILAVFGQTQSAIHFGVLILNTATIVFLFLLAKRLFGPAAGVAAAVFFAITSISSRIEATANAENFVIFFAIPGILLLMKFTDSRKIINLIFGALLLGIAFLMKQHGAAFILFGFFYLLYKHFQNKPVSWKKFSFVFLIYSFFTVLPFLITCLILWYCGVFEKFWFWTFEYARHYVGLTSIKQGFANFQTSLKMVVPFAFSIWLFAFAGLLSGIWNRQISKHSLFIIAFLFFSFLSVTPGLYFRPHYYVLFLPWLSVSAAAGIIAFQDLLPKFVKSDNKKKLIPVLLILTAWLQCFYSQRHYLKQSDPEIISRFNFGFLPFPETLKIAKYIKENSGKDDKIAVFGSEPQIYFYSQRRSATSFIYTYPLMEKQPYALEMQKEMIAQIEKNEPKFFVVIKTVDSWTPVPGSERYIFEWADNYIPANYQQVGLVEIFKDQQRTVYRWDSIAQPVQSENWLMIFERKN